MARASVHTCVRGVCRAHSKYVVRVAWAGDGRHLVSCSHDQSVGVHVVHAEPAQPPGSNAGAAAAGRKGDAAGAEAFGGGVQSATLITIRKVSPLTERSGCRRHCIGGAGQAGASTCSEAPPIATRACCRPGVSVSVPQVQYTTAVQDVAFLHDGVTLVVALRDTNYLRVMTLDTAEV